MTQPSKADRLLFASLHGRSCFHVQNGTPPQEAAADLREVATVERPRETSDRHRGGRARPAGPKVVRVDLLSEVAGHHLGAYEASPMVAWWSERAAALLIAAGGTDEVVRAAAAAAVQRRPERPGGRLGGRPVAGGT